MSTTSAPPLLLRQSLIGGQLLSGYEHLSKQDKLSDLYKKSDFVSLADADAKDAIVNKIGIRKSDIDFLFDKLNKDEIYDLLSSEWDAERVVEYVKHVFDVKDAIVEAIKQAESFSPSTITPAGLTKLDIENWAKQGTSPTTPVVTEMDHCIEYKFEYNNHKSLFLALVYAVPELLNELILRFTHMDGTDQVLASNTIDEYKVDFLSKLNDRSTTNDELANSIATLVMISVTKLVEQMHDLFEELVEEASETRVALLTFVLEVLVKGIQVNDDEVWGRADKLINGVAIRFNPSASELVVVCDKVFISRYVDVDSYEKWLPSSFYSQYDTNGSELSTIVDKTQKEFWSRLVSDGYNSSKSNKNIFKQIQRKLY